MVEDHNSPHIPRLRFPEFRDEWQISHFEKYLKSIVSGKSSTLSNGQVYPIYGSTGVIGRSAGWDYEGERILIARVGANAGCMYKVNGQYKVSDNTLIISLNEDAHTSFIQSLLLKYNLNRLVFGSGQPLVTGGQLKKIKVTVPAIKEQQKVASFLMAVDEKIGLMQKRIELLEKYKKGVMQKIFSQQIRFKDENSKDFPEWVERKLVDIFDYEQPTKYIVRSTEYKNEYKTPVLTAGKTFILGYTNETEGLFEKPLPVVIFDDFTTASKYVDFPFKVKSSAIKILRAKHGVNPKIAYELLKRIKFSAEDHKRYWIGEYQGFKVQLPSNIEQQKIADFLTALDDKIELENKKLEQAIVFKKVLLQQMFV